MFEDEYERVRLLGEGAFGAAYLVRSKTSGVQQVAKEIRIAHLTDKQRETALAESEVLRQMNHSNIVAYIASFLEGPKLYIVMEFADGGNLADKIAQRKDDGTKFEERDIMFTFVQVSLALLHIHARKTVHRDLKPLNIFLTVDGIVKLGDFGIAKVMDSTTSGAQTTIGTPFYLSPEICNNEAYGVKSDLWSLGVVTFELAHLRVPFHANSLPATALKILGADPDPLPEMYTKDLQWIVDSFLQKDPKDRPRLDHVMKMPYVQKHIQGLKDHVKRTGTGGCEAMVIRRRSQEPDIPKDVILEVSGSYLKADKRRMDGPSAAKGNHDRAGAGAGGADADAARQRRHDPETQQQRRAEAARQAAHDEFFRTRQAAAQTRARVEAAMREEAESAKQQGLRGEERKAQVRQKAQDERQEKEAARLQELEQARKQVKADNQKLIERKQGGAATAKGSNNADSKEQSSSGQHADSAEEDGSATMKFEDQGDGASTQHLPVAASEAEEDALRDALLEPEDGNSHGNDDDAAALGAATIGFMSPGPEAAAEVHALEEALAGILEDGASTMKLDSTEDGASTMKLDGNDQEASLEDGHTVRADELADELADNELGSRTLGRDELGSAEEVESAKTLRQTEIQLQTTMPPEAAASAAAEAEEDEEEDVSPQPQQEEEPEEEGLMDFSTLFFDKAKPKPKLSSENRKRPERLEKTTGHPTVTRITSPSAEGPMSKTAGPSRHPPEARKEQRALTQRRGEPKGEGHQHQQPHHAQPKRRAQGQHAHAEVALEQHRGPAASASAASLRSGAGAGAGTGSSAAAARNRGGPAPQGGAAQPKGNGASGSSRSAASGTPAHWLRRTGATPEPQRPRAGDASSRDSSDEAPNGRRRANKTQTAPAAGKGGGGGGAGRAKSSAEGKSAKAPNGGGTLAQLEDALASALCSTDGVHEQDDGGATIKLPAGKALESDMGSTSRTLASTRAPGTREVGSASRGQSSDSDS